MERVRDVIEESKRVADEARRLLDDTDGPPIRIRYVAALLGMSRDKVLDDGRRGEFAIRWQRCGTKRYAFIERADARRYVERITAV